MKQILISIALMIGAIGCAHEVRFVDMKEGITLIGEYNTGSKTIMVTLPTGELMQGQYVALTNTMIGYGSLFYGANIGSMFSVMSGGSSTAYALLTGQKGTIMEIIVNYSEWDGHGFGIAKTNKGEEYKVIF